MPFFEIKVLTVEITVDILLLVVKTKVTTVEIKPKASNAPAGEGAAERKIYNIERGLLL